MQSWATFLRNHGHEIWAFDSLQAYDLLFRPLFAFFLAPAVSSACRCSPNSSSGGQILQVEEGNRPSAGELRQRPVPAFDRLVLDVGGAGQRSWRDRRHYSVPDPRAAPRDRAAQAPEGGGGGRPRLSINSPAGGDWHCRHNLLPCVQLSDRSNAVSTLQAVHLAPGASSGEGAGDVPGAARATCGR